MKSWDEAVLFRLTCCACLLPASRCTCGLRTRMSGTSAAHGNFFPLCSVSKKGPRFVCTLLEGHQSRTGESVRLILDEEGIWFRDGVLVHGVSDLSVEGCV